MYILLLSMAMAGYGDVRDGYPSWEERWTHLWTNAARVAPEEFQSEYREGGCSYDTDFSEDEKQPKDPLYLDYALTEVARLHSADMAENNCFQHESCDGTDTWTRIGNYYSESYNLGENIAYAGADGRFAVLQMWMCSHSGHRANIMNAGFNELGVGFASAGGYNFFTQDFSGGNLTDGSPPVRMAVDDHNGAFYADWGDSKAPVAMNLVLDGKKTPMELIHGVKERGIWYAKPATTDCAAWWVSWEMADGTKGSFPEDGAYQVGCETDWVAKRPSGSGSSGEDGEEKEGLGEDGLTADDIRLSSCSSVEGMALWGLVGVLGLRRRRG